MNLYYNLAFNLNTF